MNKHVPWWRTVALCVLILVGIGLIITSFMMPWWSCDVSEVPGESNVTIYGWGLRHELVDLRQYVIEDETPQYQTVLAWVYVGASCGLALSCIYLRNKIGSILLGVIGLSVILYAIIAAFVVISNRYADFGMSVANVPFPLQGWVSFKVLVQNVTLFSTLRAGYYLAYAAGAAFISASIFHAVMIRRRTA